MTGTLAAFNQLTDAEQYFDFFNLPYDREVVSVNRLHILQKFSNIIKGLDLVAASETDILDHYRAALQQAYTLFLSTNALDHKLFKVFNDKPKNVVMLSAIGSED